MPTYSSGKYFVWNDEPCLEREVDERVGDGEQSEEHAHDEEGAEVAIAEQLECAAQRRAADRGVPGSAPVLDEEHQHAEPEQRDEERDDEHRVVRLGRGAQDEERDDRTRDRAGGVERAVHAERGAEPLRTAS